MAEVKNSFISSKMNKDLDDRLIPNSEYRDALNITVGKSESDSIGTVQNVLGNYEIKNFLGQPLESNTDLVCIGFFMDNQNNRIYRLLTDYTDDTPSSITMAPEGTTHKITVYDFNASTYNTLVEGIFLNFSTTNIVTGINLLEGLLFWTDNRNQPRKINYNNCINNPTYYTTETQISIAKYAPVESPLLYREVIKTVTADQTDETLQLNDTEGLVPGMTLISFSDSGSPLISGDEFITILSIQPPNQITLYSSPTTLAVEGQTIKFLISTMTNQENNPAWPGDPAYLESKYVRFSYRFKFDDNEYSIFAPFSQIAFIPNQKGYFINGDEQAAYRSTILKWMENNTNNIELLIPLPDTGTNIRDTYKIVSVDILYKESNSLAVKVLDTIDYSTIKQVSPDTNIFVYNYQSQKPYKTLPEDQITRVYDKIPTRALSQELSGNRVIYGNFYTTYTPPSYINYNVSALPKTDNFTNFIEYPNHTLKQNRNYQVGFIVADKFGRQSSVILSTVDLLKVIDSPFRGSTVYSPYETTTDSLWPGTRNWFGNALKVLVNDTIKSDRNIPQGTPGLYAVVEGNGFSITSGTVTGDFYSFHFNNSSPFNPITLPEVGQYLRGKYTDYVKILTRITFGYPVIISCEITTDGEISDLYNYNDPGEGQLDLKFAYSLNEIGWYSYKVVVKQKEQDYYNVYLPGMLNGYPVNQTSGSQVVYSGASATTENGINSTDFPVNEVGKTSHVVLINDNINKVPRDLSEVGPDQKQYRSSVELYGRVENYAQKIYIEANPPTMPNTHATFITYDATALANEDAILIKPGDGIQSEEATISDNVLYKWYANTVVVSNVVVGGVGTITFSPANPIPYPTIDPWINFVITRAENMQYYPLRKADIVNTIAYSTDFNFLQNTVNNVQGTAGLNLYQLQSNPLVGRISTSKDMGVIGIDMVPILGVYETAPVESMLDLFWETASTGLISDLNWDVNVGFNGATTTSNLDFKFVEDQDPEGINTIQGEPDSPFITDSFYFLNNAGFPLPLDAAPILVSVYNSSAPPINFVDKFDIVIGDDANSYRIKILDDFMFNHEAPNNSKFEFKISTLYDDIVSLITFSGRLENAKPQFTPGVNGYDRTIQRTTTDIVIISAVNGTHSNVLVDNQDGLAWSIINGNTFNYFSIDAGNGQLSLIDHEIPLGVYPLEIKIQDAMSFATTPPSPLINANAKFATKENTYMVTITVGEEPVNSYLEYWNNNGEVLGTMPVNNVGQYVDPAYFAIYVGAEMPGPGFTAQLPTPPGVAEAGWNDTFNVPYENGAQGDPYPNPKGLEKGALRFKWYTAAQFGPQGTPYNSKADVLVYYRQSNVAPNNVWQLVKDSNGAGSTVPDWDLPETLTASTYVVSGHGEENIQTTRGIIRVSTPGEYCFAIKAFSKTGDAPAAVVEDANFYYNITSDSLPYTYTNPFPPKEHYLVSLTTYFPDLPNAVPYNAQSAISGYGYTVTSTVTADAPPALNSFYINPLPGPEQQMPWQKLVNGLWIGTGTNRITGKVVYADKILIYCIDNVTFSAGTSITFRELQPDGGINFIKPMNKLWANSKDPIFVNQFYQNSGFIDLWNPPVDDKFYNYQNSPTKDKTTGFYIPPPNNDITAYNSAQIDLNGKVITQVGTGNVKGYNRVSASTSNTIPYILIPESIEDPEFVGYFGYTGKRAVIGTITSNSIKVTNCIDGYKLSYSTECTTPTENYYEATTIDLFADGDYTILDLEPNTVYYILLYPAALEINGYPGGEYLPSMAKTLAV